MLSAGRRRNPKCFTSPTSWNYLLSTMLSYHQNSISARGALWFDATAKDESGLAAVFADAASSASHIEASKLCDATALPGSG
eukprot:7054055-Pyramimonas_sp.AAC.1